MFQVLAVHHFYFLLRRQRLMPETSASWFFTVFKYSHISSQLILSIVLQLFQRGTPTLVLTGTSIPSYITWSILVDWLYNIEEIKNRWLMSYNIICVLFLALDYSFSKKNNSFLQTPDIDDFEIIKPISRGAFGYVLTSVWCICLHLYNHFRLIIIISNT